MEKMVDMGYGYVVVPMFQVATSFKGFIMHPSFVPYALVTCIGLLLLVLLIPRKREVKVIGKAPPWRGTRRTVVDILVGSLSSRQRREYVAEKIEDVLVDGIEDLVYHDQITRQEADIFYRMLASKGGLKGLEKKLTAEGLKRAIKNRLNNKDEKKEAGLMDKTSPAPKPKSALGALWMKGTSK